jgi:TAG lipase/steryl ester hydrolase/phospholipase A2/LPA acyltransferase
MDRLFEFRAPIGLDFLSHGRAAWSHGARPLKKQRTGGEYASLVQPLSRLVRESLDTVHNLSDTIASLNVGGYDLDVELSDEQIRLRLEEQERWILEDRLRAAKAHGQWVKAARELDMLDGCDEWKAEDENEHYDHEDLRRKLQNLESARDNEDLARMLRLIRLELGRDVAGIGNPKLYEECRVGTKDLIERYIETAVDTIESAMRLAARSKDSRAAGNVKQQILQARQAYGRTGLLLSGGGTMGMMHIGVIKAMFEAGVLPRVISGASAGSIVAAVVCTKKDEEIPGLLGEFCNDLEVFTKGEGQARWSSMMYRLFTKGSLYDIKNLENVMQGHVKDMTFQEAYNRTNRILSIAVSRENANEEPLLLNYATAPNVLIRSAVAASCSVPFIYRPAPLYERNPLTGALQRFGGEDAYFIDGSVSHDIPLSRLRAMLDVNHFIVSQVNPHIAPFIRKGQTNAVVHPSQRSWADTLTEMARSEFVYRLRQLSEFPIPAVRKLTHIGSSILEQTYTGDITILPETSFGFAVLSNPTPQFMVDAMEKGERATWPEINRIERRTAIERAIDKSLLEARERIHFSDSQVNLRLAAMRRQSTAEKFQQRGRRRRSSVIFLQTHRPTQSLSDPISTSTSLQTANARSPRSSSEDRPLLDSSPSLIPDFTSYSDSETDESETEASQFRKFNSKNIPNWPYGSTSQPATPSVLSKAFNFTPSPRSLSPVLTMTPATGSARGPSSPEITYKRLFHAAAGSKQAPGDGSSLLSQRDREGGRRSGSTGMKGLRPPGGR